MTISNKSEGRSYYYLGKAYSCRRGEIPEWTNSGEMRHPVYLGLRADKRPEEVVRERETVRK